MDFSQSGRPLKCHSTNLSCRAFCNTVLRATKQGNRFIHKSDRDQSKMNGSNDNSEDILDKADVSPMAIWSKIEKSSKIQRPGIEPGTSAVLKPRHNQLDHLCSSAKRRMWV